VEDAGKEVVYASHVMYIGELERRAWTIVSSVMSSLAKGRVFRLSYMKSGGITTLR